MSTQISRPGIPVHAKRVFQGVIFEVWQWEQEMFDGSTEIFEKIWRIPTVVVIATVGDKIIIEHQDQPDKKGAINLISGRANKSTDMLSEAKREMLEETGYASDQWQHFRTYGNQGKLVHEVHFFVAKNCKKITEPTLDPGEKIQIQLISFEELLALAHEPTFWSSPEFVNLLLRVQHDEKKRNEFKSLLFS